MNALRTAANRPPVVPMSSGIVPASPELAEPGDAGSSAPTFSVQHPTGANPFASLKQERTVESKVNAQLLTLTKGMPMSGATQVYEVPDELLALARRNRPAKSSKPPAPAAASGAPEAKAALPSIAAPAPPRSFNWLAVSVVAYALICITYWVLSR